MVDGVDESQADVGVVAGHKHHVKELLAVGVQLPQANVHRLQSLPTTPRNKTQIRSNAPYGGR